MLVSVLPALTTTSLIRGYASSAPTSSLIARFVPAVQPVSSVWTGTMLMRMVFVPVVRCWISA